MQALVSKVESAIPEVTEIQNGLADEGQDELNQSLANLDKKPDGEMAQTMTQLKTVIEQNKAVVQKYRNEEQKKADAKKEKETDETQKERTNKDKSELSAFLGTSSEWTNLFYEYLSQNQKIKIQV